MASIRMHSQMDLAPLKRMLRELERQPTERTSARLDRVLGSAFATTQARVHVLSGVLKASGDITSSSYGSEWRGSISYGREAYWAPWEFARHGHDPYAGLNVYEDTFEAAIDETFRHV